MWHYHLITLLWNPSTPFLESVRDLLRDKFGDNIAYRVFSAITPSIERVEKLVSNGVFGGLLGIKKCCPDTYQEDECPFFALFVSFSFVKNLHTAKIQIRIKKLHQLKKK
jgi:hypothetical protein